MNELEKVDIIQKLNDINITISTTLLVITALGTALEDLSKDISKYEKQLNN